MSHDYKKNIDIKRENNDGIITMNDAIFVELVNNVYASSQYYEEQGFEATASQIKDLWRTLIEKEDVLHHDIIK